MKTKTFTPKDLQRIEIENKYKTKDVEKIIKDENGCTIMFDPELFKNWFDDTFKVQCVTRPDEKEIVLVDLEDKPGGIMLDPRTFQDQIITLKSTKEHNSQRVIDISKQIIKCKEEDISIPTEWIEELTELTK